MQIERQFAGPLQDTVIQRLRDPVDGTICYLYLPISAPHSPVTSTGFVQYGPNAIGSINCMPGTPAAAPAASPDVLTIGLNGLLAASLPPYLRDRQFFHPVRRKRPSARRH